MRTERGDPPPDTEKRAERAHLGFTLNQIFRGERCAFPGSLRGFGVIVVVVVVVAAFGGGKGRMRNGRAMTGLFPATRCWLMQSFN